jgi:hypothetical protein
MPTVLSRTTISGNNIPIAGKYYTRTVISPIVAEKLKVKPGDGLVFIEDVGRIYIKKA